MVAAFEPTVLECLCPCHEEVVPGEDPPMIVHHLAACCCPHRFVVWLDCPICNEGSL